MKKKLLFVLSFLSLIASVSCAKNSSSSTTPSIDVDGSTQDIDIGEDTITTGFSLKDESNTQVTGTDNVFKITTGGIFVASGKLSEGQIYVDAANQDVEFDLEGLSLSNSSISPIFVNNCASFTLKVKKDTTNYIVDNRKTDYSTTTDETIGQAAIYVSNGDLKVNGKGTLSVTSIANSGIHGKDNVTIKNATILVKAVNNGIKGNDRVTIEENPTLGIVAGNNGIRTSNSDLGSKAQHGYIYINGGTITINSYGDGIDAAYAVEFGTSVDSDGITYSPVVDIYTNKYSSYSLTEVTSSTSSLKPFNFGHGGGGQGGPGGGFDGGGMSGGSAAEKADDSAKAVKANESITVNAGELFTYTYDDSFHTNIGTLDTNAKSSGTITFAGGNTKIKASDDGIHADGTLNVNDGTITVAESHEALEGNIINVKGGTITACGSDDGVNASSQINISGGRLDVTVPSNGDYDGIDSNGSISITGGIVITRGPNSEPMSPLDADGSITVSNATLIVVGYFSSRISYSSLTKTSLSGINGTGDHTITVNGTEITYNNQYSYSGSTTVLGSGKATAK